MHILFLFSFLFSASTACFQVRRFNECGCFDYKPLSRNQIAKLDPELSIDISKGNLTNPIFIYGNCNHIYMECDPESLGIKTLLRTNWPEKEIIYKVDMNTVSRTSALWFNVECNKTTHEWKYSVVEDNRDIVTESVICHSV